MKNIIMVFMFIFLLSAFAVVHQQNKAQATVQKQDGLFVFIRSSPDTEYESLGEHSPSFYNASPTQIIDFSIHKCKKKFPTANGIIFSQNMYRFEAIIIKEAKEE